MSKYTELKREFEKFKTHSEGQAKDLHEMILLLEARCDCKEYKYIDKGRLFFQDKVFWQQEARNELLKNGYTFGMSFGECEYWLKNKEV